YIRYRLVRIDWSHTQLHFVSGDPGEVEQVINQLGFQLDIATDHRHRCFSIFSLCRLCFERFQRGNDRSEWRAQFVRKHRQEMVFSAIRGFYDAFLLLKLVFDTPSLGHASGKCHRRYGEHCSPRLHGEQRLILTLTNEWPKAAHCSPHRYCRQNENTRGSLALSEAESGPNHNRAANKSDGIIFGGDLQPAAKDNCTQ